jgi:alkylation response protein AidB-like acyl-CoA dehydrogenase
LHTTLKVLPSSDAGDAIEGLADVVGNKVPDPVQQTPTDGYFLGDFSGLWAALQRDGWTSLAAPADGGGGDDAGLDLVDLLGVAEVWGRYLVPLPYLQSVLAARWSGDESSAAQGATFALWSERCSGPISPFGGRDGIVILAAMPGSGAPGGVLKPELQVGAPSLPLAGAAGPTAISPDAAREIAALALSEAVGAASVCLDRSIAYAGTRVQFGKAIGSQQAVKHHVANMHIAAELARSAALGMVYAEADELPGLVTTGFGFCSTVWETATQVHGGIGYTWEGALHYYERHILALRAIAEAAAPVARGNG